MQQTKMEHNNYHENPQRLSDKKVADMLANKRRLVEVPYTATLAHTMNALVANQVLAVPVAAPPGQWIGAGGSMIVEADRQTGAARKHYIGIATMLDVLAHIAGSYGDRLMADMEGGGDGGLDLEHKMADPVSSIIGHCVEGLSLWTLNPNTSIIDCMEVFSKGIHRAMVPLDSHMENVSGAEIVESASSYRMITQMDVLRFLKEHAESSAELNGIMARTVSEVGAVTERVYAITDRTKVINAIKCMRIALLNAVPIVNTSSSNEDDHKQLVNGRGRRLLGTFSATDIRGCHLSTLKTWLSVSALEFTETIAANPLFSSNPNASESVRELVACGLNSTLAEVVEKVVTKHVHRIWVVDQQGLLMGLISLTDVIRVIRHAVMSES